MCILQHSGHVLKIFYICSLYTLFKVMSIFTGLSVELQLSSIEAKYIYNILDRTCQGLQLFNEQLFKYAREIDRFVKL